MPEHSVLDPSAEDRVVEVADLSRKFGAKKALDDVSLTVARGRVFGLVGENGAGKSTLIKHLLGLWRAQTGSVRVFGLDPVAAPAAVLVRIGYLSEQPDLPGWMRVGELLRYTQAFYPRWDESHANRLRDEFDLDPRARIKSLSKGQKAKLGLIAAEAHRPDLLMLDEPSSGLDPMVRRDILEAIIRTVTVEGRTVVFSSHLLDEIERVSDDLAILHRGRLVVCEPLDDVKLRHRRLLLHFEMPRTEPPKLCGAIGIAGRGREWSAICDVGGTDPIEAARSIGATIVEESPASLDEIFIAHASSAPNRPENGVPTVEIVPSPTAALLWEIWRRRRSVFAMILAVAIGSWLLEAAGAFDYLDDEDRLGIDRLLAMYSFLVLFAAFNHTDYGDDKIARFPRRLFTLPVSSLRLVAVPVCAGVVAVEALYLLWMERLMGGAPGSSLFPGVLLGAFMVFYLTTLWTLARLGLMRLVVLGVIAAALLAVGFLPRSALSVPAVLRSPAVLSGLVAASALGAFLIAWAYVARQRSLGEQCETVFALLGERVADEVPWGQPRFASAASAQFWFEWRSAGIFLPTLVGCVLLIIGVVSFVAGHDAANSPFPLLVALGAPILLAVPVGGAFSRPNPRSEELSVPAFVAIRPLDAQTWVAIKVKVAGLSVALSWLFVLAFLSVWLPLEANLDSLSRLAIQWWAFHEQSSLAVYGTAALILFAGLLMTWRFLVSNLWLGLLGNRILNITLGAAIVVFVLGCLLLDVAALPRWLLEDPRRMTPVVWAVALLVIAKFWLAARWWRGVESRLVWQYLAVWLAGTMLLVALGLVVGNVVATYLPMDTYRFRSLVILLALLVMPLARLGLAPSSLATNRHRG